MIVYLLEGERDIGFVEHTNEIYVREPEGRWGRWMPLSRAERPRSWPSKNFTARAFDFVLSGEFSRQRFAELGTYGRVEAA